MKTPLTLWDRMTGNLGELTAEERADLIWTG